MHKLLIAFCLVLALVPRPGSAQDGTVSPAAAGTAPWLAINLAGASDWSAQDAFINKMHTARRWIGHMPGRWGGWEYADIKAAGLLDENGWPNRIPRELEGFSALILTDMPENATAMAGKYHLTYEGRGRVEISGRAQNVIPGRGRQAGNMTFDYTPGEGLVMLTIRQSDPNDPVRNITVVHERHLDAHARGELFNPDWTRRIEGVRALRFMDWGNTNDSTLSRWEDRPQVNDFSWENIGIPLEIMIRLANELGADPWFTIPHLADDDYIRRTAEVVRDQLDPERRAHIELSNEVWNWQFQQAHWAEEQARARWDVDYQWQQYYAKRAAQMVMIFDDVFEGQHDRLVRVIATQAVWQGLEKQLKAELWQAEDPANPSPPDLFDAYAITGYFSAALGHDDKVDHVRAWLAEAFARAEAEADAQDLQGSARDDHIATHRFDHAVELAAQELWDGSVTGNPSNTLQQEIEVTFPYHAEIAQRWGLDLIMYEGGSHVVGLWPHVEDEELTEFFIHLNYTPEMGALYERLLAGWYAAGGTLFNAFFDVGKPVRYGSWGHLRHNADHNPRWEALVTFDPATVRP